METFVPRLHTLPPIQRELWPYLEPANRLGYVLYGGTAIALRLGHRQSIDFDFFCAASLDRTLLREALPFLRESTVRQDHRETFEVVTATEVKVSFFGGIDFGHVGEPQQTADGVMTVASLDDLLATKVKVILQRAEAKDYRDISAMVSAGVRLDRALAAAERLFHPTFGASESLKALVYFEGGDLSRLAKRDRDVLVAAASEVKSLPSVIVRSGLRLSEDSGR